MKPNDRTEASDEGWIDELLRRDAKAQPHIGNDGFTEALMRRLPPRPRAAPRAIVAVSALCGTLLCLLFTPATAALTRAFAQLLSGSLAQGAWALVPVLLLFVLGVGAAAAR